MLHSGENDQQEFSGETGGAIVPRVRVSSTAIEPLGPFDEPLGDLAGVGSAGSFRSVKLASILRFKWSILAVCVILAVPSIAAIWRFVVPQYTAKGEIHVRPFVQFLVFKTPGSGAIPFYRSYLSTQVAIMRSPTVMQRVLDRPDVQATGWYQGPGKPLLGHSLTRIERLHKHLSIRPRGRTEILDVAMTARNAKDAATIVNAVLEEYIKHVHDTSYQSKGFKYEQLTQKYDGLRQQLEGLKKTTARLRRLLGTGDDPGALVLAQRMRLEEMRTELDKIDLDAKITVWLQKELQARVTRDVDAGDGSAAQPDAKSAYEHDGEWWRLHLEVLGAQHKIDLEQEQLGESHPKMVGLRKNVTYFAGLLKTRERMLDKQRLAHPDQPLAVADPGSNITDQLERLNGKIKLLNYKREVLTDIFMEQDGKFKETLKDAELLAKENEEIRHLQELYDAVRGRLDAEQMESNVPGSIRINAEAIAPSEPSRDRRFMLTVMVILVGVGLGVVQAYFRACCSQIIHEAGELPGTVQAPFLGQLPLVSTSGEVDPENCHIQKEYVRMVRTALLQRIDDGHGSAVLITSAAPGAGKTTFAMMLAESLANCGKKVLLVDADLRNPTITKRFGFQDKPGLLAVLRDQEDNNKAIVESETNQLSIMPAGRLTNGNDPEFMANGKLSACMSQWRDEYDVVLLDTSPVLPVADARILSRQVDGTVMVVREGHCQREDVVDALAYLSAAGGKLLGTVYIGASGRRGGYNGYYYNEKYSYPTGGKEKKTDVGAG